MIELINCNQGINQDKMTTVANSIRNGAVVVFPTETVYGIGANALNDEAVKKIFVAKNRPMDNPLIVHISNNDMLEEVACSISNNEKLLMKNFWPGPLTIILPKGKVISNLVSCGLDTIGVRMPSNEIALALIEASKVPIAAPSANVSGRPSGTAVSDIAFELQDKVDYIIDGGMTNIGLESTVVKVVDDTVKILRPGAITPENITSIGLNVELDSHLFSEARKDEKVESPGMKHRHYAPNITTIMVYSNNDEKEYHGICKIIEENTNQKIGIMGFDENKNKYNNYPNVTFLNIGPKENLEIIAKNIFTMLRKLDQYHLDLSIVEGVEKKGLGLAIMNRLTRACGYHVIEL
ncbi:MAG: L-threonylcarbamoyladenylate synthase [Clostridia bacterium]|nr:L-threonylcarbamoyladenylate synthase [Clostridia bacterium]